MKERLVVISRFGLAILCHRLLGPSFGMDAAAGEVFDHISGKVQISKFLNYRRPRFN
jgi:hypothetical protein